MFTSSFSNLCNTDRIQQVNDATMCTTRNEATRHATNDATSNEPTKHPTKHDATSKEATGHATNDTTMEVTHEAVSTACVQITWLLGQLEIAA
jgi:hypothetical protein